MKSSFIFKVHQSKKQMALWFLILCSSLAANAQNGTYEKKASNGAYGVISIQKKGEQVTAEIFTWWNTASAQTGSYYGKGVWKNNTVVLRSEENDPDCTVTLNIVNGKINVLFNHCSTDHLTEDFNGFYNKITDAVAGEYVVKAPKAYFHQKPDAGSKVKSYVVKGDKVRLDIDRIAASRQNWLYVYFVNKAGKETNGFISISDLSMIE